MEPCPAVTVGRLPSLTVGSKVMSFAFSEGSFNESAEFDLDVTTAFLLSDLSLSKKKKKKKETIREKPSELPSRQGERNVDVHLIHY